MIRAAAAAALRRRACAAPAIRPAFRPYTTTNEPAKRTESSSASAPPPPPEPRIDGAVVGCYAGERPSLEHLTAAALAVNERAHHALFMQLEHSGFRGNAGECRVLYPAVSALDHVGEPVLDEVPPRVAVVGLGKRPVGEEKQGEVVDEAAERARRAAAIGVKALKDTGARTIAIEPFLPTTPTDHARAEGAVLATYSFDHLKTKKAADRVRDAALPPLHFVPLDRDGRPATLSSDFKAGLIYAQAQNLARSLMESPANLMTPRLFAETAVTEFKGMPNTEVVVRDEKWVLDAGMHAFHAVAKGSKEPLQYVEVHYRGRGEDQPVDVVLVGKGVTFDSGGISIKPSAGMAMMKGDMGGAATVLSAVHGLARLGARVNVTALIPLCENMPSSSATKPGDVVRAANGLTIEIDNTDAEGRLLLGDALFHATSFHARSAIIDVATLTGAMDVALGRQYAGVFTNSDALWTRFTRAARVTGDKAWRMPLDDGYLEVMKSHVADLKNAGDRSAGACTAAIFLKQFLAPADPEVGTAKVEGEYETHPVVQAGRAPAWAHVDIAGVMHYGAPEGAYNVKGMSGRPTRLLMELVRLVGEEPIVEEEGAEGADA
ncbi:bleomycin hydrolase [Allomyces javanicus]|nr:bleomycin hydrolase [Allomyces javanicus]